MPGFIRPTRFPSELAQQLIGMQATRNDPFAKSAAGLSESLMGVMGMLAHKQAQEQSQARQIIASLLGSGRLTELPASGAPPLGQARLSELIPGLPIAKTFGARTAPDRTTSDTALDVLKTGRFRVKKSVPEGVELSGGNFLDFFEPIQEDRSAMDMKLKELDLLIKNAKLDRDKDAPGEKRLDRMLDVRSQLVAQSKSVLGTDAAAFTERISQLDAEIAKAGLPGFSSEMELDLKAAKEAVAKKLLSQEEVNKRLIGKYPQLKDALSDKKKWSNLWGAFR